MFNYRVTDTEGNQLGVLSLVNEDVPRAVLDGIQFSLGALVDNEKREIRAFTLIIEPFGQTT